MTEATSLVRMEMMQNRLHLQNYLLSGDIRNVEKMNDGEHRLSDALHHSLDPANSEPRANPGICVLAARSSQDLRITRSLRIDCSWPYGDTKVMQGKNF
jgi:hypothetical protein